MSAYQRLRKLWKSWQCPGCKAGKSCEHKEGDLISDNNGNKIPVHVFLEDSDGKRTYYCQAACALLQLNKRELNRIIQRAGGGYG